jgi:hypothetical protein
VEAATSALAAATHRVDYWNAALELKYLEDGVAQWWQSTQPTRDTEPASFTHFRRTVDLLFDVEWPTDSRIGAHLGEVRRFAQRVATDSPWLEKLVASLLEGEMWAACEEHVRRREGRVRELRIGTGVQELMNIHERTLNASVRVASNLGETRLIQDWFGIIAGYGWWLGDDIPGLVRRCLTVESGDCARIGATEIAALMRQMDERAQLLDDWTRRLFIGMWNAMPAVGILFIVELCVVCVSLRVQAKREVVLRLENDGGGGAPVSYRRRMRPLQISEGPVSTADEGIQELLMEQ